MRIEWRIRLRGHATPRRLLGTLLAIALGFPALAVEAGTGDPVKTRELVAVLHSSTDLFARARACQQLAVVGTPEAVPSLAALLDDEKLGGYARDALEVMPDERALEALRESLGRLSANRLIGVVNSLGMRRDPKAVPALGKLAATGAPSIATASIVALGRIASSEAARLVQASLHRGADETRIAAAEACLLMASQHMANGRRDDAVQLYDVVRVARLPGQLSVTATHGAIVARGDAGLPLLVENLRSSDVALRDVALRSIREFSGSAVTSALIAELGQSRPVVQALIIAALVDLGDTSVVGAIEALATAADEDVRVAALDALGRIGSASSLSILLREACATTAGSSVSAAMDSLARIAARETNTAILRALPAATPEVQVRLIGLLGKRGAENATSELLRLARGADAEVSRSALRALSLVSRPADLPALIDLALAMRDAEWRTLADRAIVTTSMKVLEPAHRADALLAAFRQADVATKIALLRPLGTVVRNMGATYEAFVAIRGAVNVEQQALRDAALAVLAAWPDATPATTLLDFARSNPTAPSREVALLGAIRMAADVAAGRDRSPLNPMSFLADANALVGTREEKLGIVSGLGNVKHTDAFQLLIPYLDDPAVQAEAALAVVQIAPALLNSVHGPAVKATLATIASSGRADDIRQKAGRIASASRPPAAKKKGGTGAGGTGAGAIAAGNRVLPVLPPGVLFNGSDLSGWEGDPAVWRVRDGAIVGGSLEGNPRNEFLATKRTYRNFVLRLEYKIVGTEGFVNGGVQFRSVRVTQPPNEMSGYQADIGAGTSGSLYDETRRKKYLLRAAADQIARLERSAEWNRYEIRCVGPTIELMLNGEKTVTYTESDSSVQTDGVIGLQIHGKCKAEIAFRNIVIEELP